MAVEVLCTPDQDQGLVEGAAAALGAVPPGDTPGAWRTVGIRLRRPRTPAEHAWLVESLSQPDDPLAPRRRPRVLEVGGRGSWEQADAAAGALGRMLCAEDFHPGPCPIPWSTSTWSLEDETRAE